VVMCSWPTTSSNPKGLYLRADTTKFSIGLQDKISCRILVTQPLIFWNFLKEKNNGLQGRPHSHLIKDAAADPVG